MRPWEYGDKRELSAEIPQMGKQDVEMVELMPCLPWQLKSLLRAATGGHLTFDLPGIPDVQLYTLAWGSSYLTGDRTEALRRLWEVYGEWQKVKALTESRAA